MQFESQQLDGVMVIRIQGEIDLQSSPKLRETLRGQADAKCPALVVNLSGVKYMDSSGLATLVEYYQMSRKHKGKLALCALTPRVKNLFEVARLEQIFQIVPDEAAALAAVV